MSGPLIPSLCYVDAPAAIEWLRKAFGFHAQLVVPGPDDTVMHSQLVCESPPCIVMVFTQRDDDFGRHMRSPEVTGGCTQSVYLVVDDAAAVDAHHDRAKEAGAKILMPPTDQDYGGRAYTCADPEGHVWSVGDYDPRKNEHGE